MRLIDSLVETLSPSRGLDRARARLALDAVRSFDGAMVGRRTAGWRATNASANETIRGPLPRLRARSRDAVRNTWWGPRVKSVTVAHAVGSGITLKPKTGSRAMNKRVQEAWAAWCKSCDHSGQLNFEGLINLGAGCIVESGEVLARFRPAKEKLAAGVVPLELQLLEPDHLDGSRDNPFVTRAGTMVDQGIEFADEKRVAYWLHRTHPGAAGNMQPGSVRVPAREVLHVYRKDRIGQGRGVPWIAPVLLKGRDVADLEEAVIVKSRVEACLTAFVKTSNTSRTLSDRATMERGAAGEQRRIEKLSPGAVIYGEPGDEVTAINPSSSVQFESVLMMNWLALAAGAGLTYDQLTGDLRRANFSSLKAGDRTFRRMIEQFQWLTLVPMMLDPIVQRWLEVAQDFGILPRRRPGYYDFEWIMPANEPIDPLKDMQADILAVRSGRTTWAQFVAAWGLDPDAQLDEIEAWLREIDRRGIALDTDPRRPSISPKQASRGDGSNKAGGAGDEDKDDDDEDD